MRAARIPQSEQGVHLRLLTVAATSALFLSACAAPTAGRYSVSAENNNAIRASGVKGLSVRSIAPPPSFDALCRGVGAIQLADGLTHEQYIEKAIRDELSMAGALASPNESPSASVTGRISKLAFSTSSGITGGYWDIDLTLNSSNGSSMDVSEHYTFHAGFEGGTACVNAAGAFPMAVQDLIGKTVADPRFKQLAAK